MKTRTLAPALLLTGLLMLIGSSRAQAWDWVDRWVGNGGGASCSCGSNQTYAAMEPVVMDPVAAPNCGCEKPCGCKRWNLDPLGIFHRKQTCCEPTCAAERAPTCGCEKPCGAKRWCSLNLDPLGVFHCKRDCCESQPACGCASEVPVP